jgi:serine phosphatase RsbU (regulator of sigma subunit)
MRLQAASLPGLLPALEGVSLSADYRPGNSEATIGGDWYDAFVLQDGRLVITIGDIVGKGLDAAVAMGKVRQAMRSAAALLPEPSAMLIAAGSAVRDVSADNFATALAALYDPKTHQLTFACAGHPGPTLLRADGSVRDHTARGIMLGLRSERASETVTISAGPGSTLAFFTDGLTEATRDIEEGYRRLRAALVDGSARADENRARALVDRVLGGRPALDDIAVLVAEIAPAAVITS